MTPQTIWHICPFVTLVICDWEITIMSQLFFLRKEGRANAVPTTINYTPDSPDLDERRGQPHRSAMVRPRPGGTTFVIIVTSAPSKFNDGTIRMIEFDKDVVNSTMRISLYDPPIPSVYRSIDIRDINLITMISSSTTLFEYRAFQLHNNNIQIERNA